MIFFLDSYERQKSYQSATNRSLDELASMRDRADELILDIWNQVERNTQRLCRMKNVWSCVALMA